MVGELAFHKCNPHSVSRGLSLLLLLALAPRGFLRFLRFDSLLKLHICVISKSIRNPKITCLFVIRMLCATLVVLLFYQQLFLVSEIDGLSTLPTTHFQSISSQGGICGVFSGPPSCYLLRNYILASPRERAILPSQVRCKPSPAGGYGGP